MKVYNAKVLKEGVNPKTNKAWTLVTFTDGTKNNDGSEKTYSTFDDELLNVVNGQWVDGVTSQADKDGKTYNNFKMADKQSVPLQFKPVVPEQSGADKAVANPIPEFAGQNTTQKAPTVPQDVWERKDLAMLAMNCNNAASQVYSATAMKAEHMAYAIELFEMWDRKLNGKPTLSENYAKVLDQIPTPPLPPIPTDEPNEIDLNSIPF